MKRIDDDFQQHIAQATCCSKTTHLKPGPLIIGVGDIPDPISSEQVDTVALLRSEIRPLRY